MISPEVAQLVSEIALVIRDKKPADVRRALADILGVFMAHVLKGVPEDRYEETYQESLDLIRDEIEESYDMFLASPEGKSY